MLLSAKMSYYKPNNNTFGVNNGLQILIIPKEHQNTIGDLHLFSLRDVGKVVVDIYIDLPKNIKPTLIILAKILRIPNYSKMTKLELLNIITPLIAFD